MITIRSHRKVFFTSWTRVSGYTKDAVLPSSSVHVSMNIYVRGLNSIYFHITQRMNDPPHVLDINRPAHVSAHKSPFYEGSPPPPPPQGCCPMQNATERLCKGCLATHGGCCVIRKSGRPGNSREADGPQR